MQVELPSGRHIRVDVVPLSTPRQAHYLKQYPGNFAVPTELTPEQIRWFVEVSAEATQLSKAELESLAHSDMLELCAAVVPVALGTDRQPRTVPSDGWMVVW